MRQLLPFLILLLAAGSAQADIEPVLDSNTAFYEGETLNYVIYPPEGFRMVDWDATADGYSFAFVPEDAVYEEADQVIGVNIFKIRGLAFEDVVTSDTAAVREHFGDEIAIWPVDSVFSASGQLLPTFYFNDPSRMLPNVMMAYVDGQTELLVLELVITDRATRLFAEDAFMECLRKIKVLPSAELGYE
jgi:hypothetical protein